MILLLLLLLPLRPLKVKFIFLIPKVTGSNLTPCRDSISFVTDLRSSGLPDPRDPDTLGLFDRNRFKSFQPFVVVVVVIVAVFYYVYFFIIIVVYR